MVKFSNGILYSKTICEFINNSEKFNDYEIYAKTFCNGRENGYILTIWGDQRNGFNDFNIWIHEHRNSEKCVIRWGDANEIDITIDNMYSEKVYNEQTEVFEEFNPIRIGNFIYNKIEEFFNKKAVNNG